MCYSIPDKKKMTLDNHPGQEYVEIKSGLPSGGLALLISAERFLGRRT